MSLDLQFEMSECLGPSLSVYSSYLVIYSSSLVIYSCSLLEAFIKGLFRFFIHMTDYFLYLCKYLAIIISQKLPEDVFPTIFPCKWWLHVTNTALSFYGGFMTCMLQYSFRRFMAFCCSSTFNLSSCFTLLAFSLLYLGLPIFLSFSLSS